MLYGYVRTSTKHQSPERQRQNILEYINGEEIKFFSEIYTGKTQDRPEWKKLLQRLKPGDRVVFDEISRMSRNAEEGFREYERLYNQGIELIFIKEDYCSTTRYRKALNNALDNKIDQVNTPGAIGKYVNKNIEAINELLLDLAKEQFYFAFEHGERELKLLSERTKEGMRIAEDQRKQELLETGKSSRRPPGRRLGSIIETEKERRSKSLIKEHAKEFGGSLKDKDLITLCGISRGAYYRYKRELLNMIKPDN